MQARHAVCRLLWRRPASGEIGGGILEEEDTVARVMEGDLEDSRH